MNYRSEQVAPGLWWLPIAVLEGAEPFVYAYALEAADGLVLVDAGFGTRTALASLEARLSELGATPADVRGVLFTHGHPDHYGLSGAIKERSGAWLALHPADRPFVMPHSRPGFLDELSELTALDLGAARRMGPPSELPPAEPNVALADGQILELAPWRVKVLHTPGHTPGHCCLRLEGTDIVLIGDHLLSRTTPNVSCWPGSDGDPLGDYVASLRRIGREAVGCLGLPGHEQRIEDIPARAAEILAHHEEQCAEVAGLVRAGHDTIGAVAEQMRWSRSWPELGQVSRVMAVGEAHAHLRALEARGELRRTGGSPARFALA